MAAGARSVDYIFQLIDRFSPVADRLAKAALQAEKTISAMGQASTRVQASQRGAAAAIAEMNRRALEANPALRSATERLKQFGAAGERAAAQVRTLTQAHKAIVQLEKEQALMARYGAPRTGPKSRADWQGQAMGNAGAAFISGYLSTAISTGMSSFLDHANEQALAKTKMGFVGFKNIMGEADKAAAEMTKKYKNISKGEAYEMMHEGVAIHGTAGLSLENIEQQVKMMSFMKVFDGGKHGENAKGSFLQVQAWIKSMEMKKVLSETDPARRKAMIDDYMQAGMAITMAYPKSQLKLTDMLMMQKRAGPAWYNFSDEFRFGYAPAMAQERGGNIVGTALMSSFASIRGGKKLSKNELGAMGQYGLLDKNTGRWTEEFQQLWGSNPFLAAADIGQRVAKYHKLDPHNPADEKKLDDVLTKSFSWLFPNRTASTNMIDMMFNNENFKKHAEYMALVRTEMKQIEEMAKTGKVFAMRTKGGAEGSVAEQWKNVQAAIGIPMEQPYIDRMNAWAKSLNWVGEAIANVTKKHPGAANAMGTAAVYGAGGLATLLLMAAGGFGLAAIRSGIGYLFAGGATGGAAAARVAAMGGGGMAAGALAGGAVAGTAVAARSGLMTRILGGLAVGLGLAAKGTNKYHLAVNGLGEGLAIAGRILKTTAVSYGLLLAYENRDKLHLVGGYLTDIAKDIGNFFSEIHKHRLGSSERKNAQRRLLDNLFGADVTLPNLASIPKRIFDTLAKSLADTGWSSYLSWQLYGNGRTPQGERGELMNLSRRLGGHGPVSAYGIPGVGYSDATFNRLGPQFDNEYVKFARNSARSGDWMSSFGGMPQGGIPSTDASRPAIGGLGFNAADIPKDWGKTEVAIRFDPVPVIPVQVVVSGSVDATSLRGTITGSSSANIHMTPRGEASPVDAMGNTF